MTPAQAEALINPGRCVGVPLDDRRVLAIRLSGSECRMISNGAELFYPDGFSLSGRGRGLFGLLTVRYSRSPLRKVT